MIPIIPSNAAFPVSVYSALQSSALCHRAHTATQRSQATVICLQPAIRAPALHQNSKTPADYHKTWIQEHGPDEQLINICNNPTRTQTMDFQTRFTVVMSLLCLHSARSLQVEALQDRLAGQVWCWFGFC